MDRRSSVVDEFQLHKQSCLDDMVQLLIPIYLMKGDVLRATTSWSQGFSAAGATSDIMMFAGNIKWRKSIFDTAGAPWQQTVDALLSNTAERSETVTLVFERELSGVDGDSQ